MENLSLPAATAVPGNGTKGGEPDWNSAPAWKMPGWFEPVVIVLILFLGCWMTRRKSYKFSFRNESSQSCTKPLLPTDSSSSLDIAGSASEEEEDDEEKLLALAAASKEPRKRRFCGTTVFTPNSDRFKNRLFSRFLYKFPFLIEIFYWSGTYLLYRLSHIAAGAFADKDVWDIAQDNALRVLDIEQFSILAPLFPIKEIDWQKWFLNGHGTLLTVLNRTYALIHIPGTVYFIAWYYYAAPSHAMFATVRRTMTLTNWLAFLIFMVYPCAPPRFLPEEYGFIDTVRREDAESVWMKGKNVNSLAAMPSMHFGYSFIVGCTMVMHSGVLQSLFKGVKTVKMSRPWMAWFFVGGIAYPALILTTIVATANHFWLDALAAVFCAAIALAFNKVFFVLVPLEDIFFWAIRTKKPKANCGYQRK